jgi:hypothetical protein
VLYAINGKHIALAKLLYGYRLTPDNSQEISTKTEGKKFFNSSPMKLFFRWHLCIQMANLLFLIFNLFFS